VSPAIVDLVEASKALSVEERKALANAIWESVSGDTNWRPSQAALAEVHRRLEEHDRHPGSAVSGEEMQQRLEQLRARMS
jgi:putative addiction module component (TIGR02574 family)